MKAEESQAPRAERSVVKMFQHGPYFARQLSQNASVRVKTGQNRPEGIRMGQNGSTQVRSCQIGSERSNSGTRRQRFKVGKRRWREGEQQNSETILVKSTLDLLCQ